MNKKKQFHIILGRSVWSSMGDWALSGWHWAVCVSFEVAVFVLRLLAICIADVLHLVIQSMQLNCHGFCLQ